MEARRGDAALIVRQRDGTHRAALPRVNGHELLQLLEVASGCGESESEMRDGFAYEHAAIVGV